MFLYSELCARAEATKPVRVGLIGAGKFDSMFLSQVPSTPGLTISAIADLDPSGAQQACATVGWPEDLIAKTHFCDDALEMMKSGGLDVIVEATGNPVVGVVHAKSAIQNGVCTSLWSMSKQMCWQARNWPAKPKPLALCILWRMATNRR